MNTIMQTIMVDTAYHEEMVPVVDSVADSTSRITDIIFYAELAATSCMHWMTLHFRQE